MIEVLEDVLDASPEEASNAIDEILDLEIPDVDSVMEILGVHFSYAEDEDIDDALDSIAAVLDL